MIGVVVLAVVSLGVGLPFVRAAGLPIRGAWLVTTIGLAPLVGMLATGIVASTLAACGVQMRSVVVTVVTAALAALAVRLRRSIPLEGPWPMRARTGGRASTVLEAAILAAGAVTLVVVGRWFALGGLEQWDGWAIWAAHAHALHVEGVATGPVFTDTLYEGTQQSYPIVLPALEAFATRTSGSFDLDVLLLVPVLWLAAGGAAIWAVLRTVVHPVAAAVVGLAVSGIPQLVENLRTNYADGALALTVAPALVLLLIWVESRSREPLVLVAFLLAAAPLVKTEGLLFSGAALIAAAVVGRHRGAALRPLVGVAVAALLPAVAWALLTSVRGTGQSQIRPRLLLDRGFLADNWRRYPDAADRLLSELVHGWRPTLVVAALALLLAVIAGRLAPLLFVFLWSGICLGGLCLVYLTSTIPLDWHLDTSAARIVLTPALGVLVACPLVATVAWDSLAVRVPWTRTAGGPASTIDS